MRNLEVTRSNDAVFYALADPTRRAVLDLLRDGGQPAGAIAKAFTVSRPAISRHLGLLLDANLVDAYNRGRHRVYQLNPTPLTAVDTWLARYRQFWSAKLATLKAFAESDTAPPLPRQSRHETDAVVPRRGRRARRGSRRSPRRNSP